LLTNDQVYPLVNTVNYHVAKLLKDALHVENAIDLSEFTKAKAVLQTTFREQVHKNFEFDIL
jgi:hypothetical protein